jgi:hypothetical protein
VKRAVKYSNLTIDGFSFELRYNASGTHGLPPGVSDPKLATYSVSGIKDAIKRCVLHSDSLCMVASTVKRET